MNQVTSTNLRFDAVAIGRTLDALSAEEMDELQFGVIGFDRSNTVCVYNRFEAVSAGLVASRVLGRHLFNEVAPCMNNFMVAARFESARARGGSLDVVIDYVLTLRMRPTPVLLRLVVEPFDEVAYIIVSRSTRNAQAHTHV